MKGPAKRGRPRMKKGQARTHSVPLFRVTKAEWEFIERRRKALGLSISEYMRRAALRGFSHAGDTSKQVEEGVTVNVGASTTELSTGAVLDRHPEYDEDELDDAVEEVGGTDSNNNQRT